MLSISIPTAVTAIGVLLSMSIACQDSQSTPVMDSDPKDASPPSSTDAGAATEGGNADSGISDGETDADNTPNLRPVFVAVGTIALRIRSTDLGMTWTDVANDGPNEYDNEYLIRGIGFGNGLFVTARGFPNGLVRTSPDGATWTDHPNITNSEQWMGGVVFSNGRFVAAGGGSVQWLSNDGINWTSNQPFNGLAVRTVVTGANNELLAAGNGSWYRSTDNGDTWVLDSNHTNSNEIKVAYCNGVFQEIGDGNYEGLPDCEGFRRCRGAVYAEGVYLRAVDRQIQRSTDGQKWQTVYTSPDSYIQDIEIGYVP